jgi:Family of unknown function (DUF6152)
MLAAVAAGLLALAVSVKAHHAPVQYETEKMVSLDGTIAEVHWANPHIWFVVEVRGADGRLEKWTVEGNGIGQSRVSGLSEDVLRVGNRARVHMRPAVDRSKREGFFMALEFQGKTFRRRPGIEVE